MQTEGLDAVLIGATGLVGSEILKILLADPRFKTVTVLTRRSTGQKSPKLVEHLVDFRKIQDWKNKVHGDVAFSALGTTRSQAGSIEAQYEVDYTYQAEFATACANGGIGTFVLISSMGADSKSKIPYTRMKGQLEDFVETLGFQHIQILRPGPLEGHREKRRLSEELSLPVSRLLSKLPMLRDIHPVTGQEVAQRAVESAFRDEPMRVLKPHEVRLGISRGNP